MAKTRKWIAGWLLALGLVVGLAGCDNSPRITWEGFNVEARGIVSDTTAMLAVSYLESYEYDNGLDGNNYLGRGLMLVDVRFKKVYWEARVDDVSSTFSGSQASDSTMLLNGPKGLWLWTVGQSAPRKLDLKWASEEMWLDSSYLRLRQWQNGNYLLLNCDICYGDERTYALVDVNRGAIEKWNPTEKEQWVVPCRDVQWSSIGGLCLASLNDSCDFALMHENMDTLGVVDYGKECSVSNDIHFWGRYVGLFNDTQLQHNPYPSEASVTGIYAIGSDWKITSSPLFWLSLGGAGFVDSLGNYLRYR